MNKTILTLEEKAKSEWLSNAVWLVCNGYKPDYYSYCKNHDLDSDNQISLQLYKNLYEEIKSDLAEALHLILLDEDEF